MKKKYYVTVALCLGLTSWPVHAMWRSLSKASNPMTRTMATLTDKQRQDVKMTITKMCETIHYKTLGLTDGYEKGHYLLKEKQDESEAIRNLARMVKALENLLRK